MRLGVWLSGLLTFDAAVCVLKQVGGLDVGVSSLWRRVQQWGAQMDAANARQCLAANALPALWERPAQQTGEQRTVPKRMGVAMDGAIIHIRQEGWKELKLGCIFEVAVRTEEDPVTQEATPTGHAVETTCVAHLGGAETLGELVWTEAKRRRWEEADETIAIADGAPWIWNQVALHFGNSLQLIDWYHAHSHLYDAARLVHDEGSQACQRWLNTRTTALYQGHAATLAQELRTAAATRPERSESLNQAAAYFQTNAHRMDYLEQREALWPIGSGVVESTAKQLKQRLCGSGMRWSRKGATNMATLRCAILSHRFTDLWASAAAAPPN